MTWTQCLLGLFLLTLAAPTTASDAASDSGEEICVRDESNSVCRVQPRFGAAEIRNQDMSSQDMGSTFDMHVHFKIETSAMHPHLENTARGFVFTNGHLGGQCSGSGHCSLTIQDLPAGFYEVRTIVVDSNWLTSPSRVFECSEVQQGCSGLLAMESYKVNFFHVTLLSTVIDPFSPVLEQTVINESSRSTPFIVANTYEVNDEGDALSDLVLSHDQHIIFVSPLVPRGDELSSLRSSSWECRFDGTSEVSSGTVSSDGMHTYRVACAVPASLHELARAQAWLDVEFFRDGADIAPDGTFRRAARQPPPAVYEDTGTVPVEICTMIRNEARYIVEFVEYHLLLGVAHIHVYLHLTTDAAPLLLEPYARRGLVTVRAWDFHWSPMFMRFQSHAANDCSMRRGAPGRPVWLFVLDVDEFLVTRGGIAIGEALQRVTDASGPGHSAVKSAWLPYSSQRAEESKVLTVERYLWHGGRFVPEVGRMLGDQQHGKVTVRADHGVHLDFSGHKATVAPGGMAEANPATLHIAHYMGRPRAYELTERRHAEVAERRSRAAEEEGVVRWRLNPLCSLGERLRVQLCARDSEEFEGAGALCAAIRGEEAGSGARGRVEEVQACEAGEAGRFDGVRLAS